MERQRAAKLTVIIGTNGTGKTTLLHEIISRARQRALIITPDSAEWLQYPENELKTPDDFLFQGVQRHIFSPRDTLDRIEFFSRGILVFDDCRSYLTSTTDHRIHSLLIRRRQRMVDVFAVGHGFNEIPPVFFTFCSDIFLFRTTDNINRRKDCLKDFDRMKIVQGRINKNAIKKPHYYEHIKF